MPVLGIVGGIGPESTIEYYRAILRVYRERHGSAAAPPILINSIDPYQMLGAIAAGELASVTGSLSREVRRLADAGATVGLLAANTPHLLFDAVAKDSPIPLVSIVAATCQAAAARGLKRLALFGTRFTMQARFYADVFEPAGLAIVAPADDEQAYIHDKYMTELLQNRLVPATRDGLIDIVRTMKDRDRIDGVILGGTELPLILPDERACDLPLLNTTLIHVDAAVARVWP